MINPTQFLAALASTVAHAANILWGNLSGH